MYPVFKSCDVAPAFAAAIQTIPPTTSAIDSYNFPVQPTAIKISAVPINVAMVIPEIGLLLEPIIPTIRLLTVTKKNPNTTIRIPIKNLFRIESPGNIGRNDISKIKARLPIKTVLNERSFSVRETATPPFSFIELTLSRNEEMIVGIVFIRVMNPPAATAPAPICRTYVR